MAESTVRRNLMNEPGYTPYCGADKCAARWPRTVFTGKQFKCCCGWQSSFEAEFIENYKTKRMSETFESALRNSH